MKVDADNKLDLFIFVSKLMIVLTLLAFFFFLNQALLAGQPSRVNSTVIPHPHSTELGKQTGGLRELRSAEGVKGEE